MSTRGDSAVAHIPGETGGMSSVFRGAVAFEGASGTEGGLFAGQGSKALPPSSVQSRGDALGVGVIDRY